MLEAMSSIARFAAFATMFAGFAGSASAFAAPADENHFPSNEDLRHVKAMAAPRLSPDGRNVLVQISDATADGAKTHIWIVDVKQNTSRQLTVSPASDKRGERAAEWMPDGDSVLFLAHRGEHTQLFRLPMAGGEAHPYELKVVPAVDESAATDAIPPKKASDTAVSAKAEPVEIDVERYFVAPDGKWIAVVAHDPETAGEKKQKDAKADAEWVDHDPHGSRLYLLDPDSGKLTATAVPPNVARVAWAKQSDKLMAITEGMNNIGDLGPDGAAWSVTVSDPQHPAQVKEVLPTVSGAAWSEDGKKFYFLAQAGKDAPPGYHDLYVLADGAAKDLSADFDGTLAHEDPLPDDGKVLLAAQTGTQVGMLRFDGEKREALKFDTAVATQLNTNAKRTGWVWLGTSSTQPTTLYYADKLGHEAKVLKTPELMPAAWTAVPSQVVQWKNGDLTVGGLLYLPPQAASHKVPLIVDVHGGPTGAFEDSYGAFVEYFAGQGWAVLRPNPRGSTGYGAAFAAANKNDLGGEDYRDIMAGVDTIIARFPIDANKLGLMGYSYGGEMAGFVEGKTDRFKAIVSGAPVIDQESEFGTESSSWYDRWFYGRPWEHAEDAWRQSPLAGAAHAKTPFMLIQGESDHTDPVGQSMEMYRALRQMGVPVELVEYPREDHGPLAGGIFGSPSAEPWHGFDGRQRIVKFFEKAFE
jgi:dipeptidyl aminopeptidase/acylaminoacyl peptidase